ncbi:MAG: hypothetical protein MHM6MM_009140, partial [Cercozoa sp. M6MM]
GAQARAQPLWRDEPPRRAFDVTSDYVPRNPCHTPSCFPREPSPVFRNPALYDRLETDTLFFAFYFQQGTYAQYLAARSLKNMHQWRYHQRYLTWFQRHDEPAITTDEYERGDYIYFDYDSNWCQFVRKNFTFEYSYLEDDV